MLADDSGMGYQVEQLVCLAKDQDWTRYSRDGKDRNVIVEAARVVWEGKSKFKVEGRDCGSNKILVRISGLDAYKTTLPNLEPVPRQVRFGMRAGTV